MFRLWKKHLNLLCTHTGTRIDFCPLIWFDGNWKRSNFSNIWIFAPKVALNLPILESISAKDTLCFFLILVIKGDANWNLTIAIFFRLRRQMASLPMSSLKATCSNLRMNLGGIASSLSPKYCFNAYSKEFVSLCTTLQIASVIKIQNKFPYMSPGGAFLIQLSRKTT